MSKHECDECRYWSQLVESNLGVCSIHGIHTVGRSPTCTRFRGHAEPIRVAAIIRQRPELNIWPQYGTQAREILRANYEDGDEVWLDIVLRGDE